MHDINTLKIEPLLPSFERKDLRGTFTEVVNEGPWETIVHGSMKKGAVMGNHYHRQCRAYFYIIQGSAQIRVRHLVDGSRDEVTLDAGKGLFFLPFVTHIINYLEDSTFLLLKSYRYTDENPDIYPLDV